MSHHYVYGSGMAGCLYDYGPHFSPTLRDAIADLVATFTGGDPELSSAEVKRMRRNLRVDGIHYFAQAAGDAGADYCEVTRQPGPCPKED